MTATTNVRLMEDLTCAGDPNSYFQPPAITIGADGIDVDLGGHTLTVSGVWDAVSGGRRYVTIRNGTIVGGEINIIDSEYGVLTDLSFIHVGIRLGRNGLFRRNRVAGGSIYAENVRDFNLIMGNTIENASIGFDGSYNTVRDNVIESGSIWNIEGHAISVIRNRMKRGAISMQNSESGEVLVMDNVVTESPGHGITVGCRPGSGPARVVGNNVSHSAGHGILIYPEVECNKKALVKRNRASDNGRCGIYAPDAVDGGHNKAKRNADPEQCVGVSCD
jgi:hypothetical protein